VDGWQKTQINVSVVEQGTAWKEMSILIMCFSISPCLFKIQSASDDIVFNANNKVLKDK